MNMESISIKNVGPIKDVRLDHIKPFTIFIGPSASGKSTILKIIALFRYIYKLANIRSYLHSSKIEKSPFRIKFKSLISNNELAGMINESSIIEYTMNGYTISFSKNKLSTIPSISKEDLMFQKGAFVSEDRILIPHWLNNRGGSLNFYFDETLQNFLAATNSISEFELNYMNMKLKIVKGANNRKRYIITNQDEKNIDFRTASSGIKTTASLAILVKFFSKDFSFKDAFRRSVLSYLYDADRLTQYSPSIEFTDMPKRIDLHVEEPELSLDPNAQLHLLDDLTTMAFHQIQPDRKMTLMMATHSPYILNYINLLMAEYESSQDHQIGLDPQSTDAFRVSDGTIYDLSALDGKGRKVINSVDLSEQIEQIYLTYKQKRSD